MNKKEEIFTIGDKTNNGTISKFEIDVHGIRVFFEEKPKNYNVSLNSLKHIKQPLFTTEDGVDIYEDKEFNCVNQHLYLFKEKGLCCINLGSHIKIFSTKEAAEEYILMNKPCLSLNDVAKVYVTATKKVDSTTSITAQNRRIQELVEEKIRQSV